jgi:putative transposase
MASDWCGVGYRMIHDRLRNEGMIVNHKRVLRLWRLLGLDRRSKARRIRVARKAVNPLAAAEKANERWAIDFLSDRLENGRPYRILAIIDVYTRECVAIEAARSMPSWRVIAALERAASVRGVPQMITSDNGPELTSHAVTEWAARNDVTVRYSRVHTPTDNPFIESFNARLRAECADLWWTVSIKDANELLADWRHRYNEERPHRSIGRIPPSRYARTATWIAYKSPVLTTAVSS